MNVNKWSLPPPLLPVLRKGEEEGEEEGGKEQGQAK